MLRHRTLAKHEPRSVTAPAPFRTLRTIDRMFRDLFADPFWPDQLESPREPAEHFMLDVDLKETDEKLELSAALPGMTTDDIDIDVTADSISISGERKTTQEEPTERYHVRQQSYGRFDMCYSLPSEVRPEDAAATYRDGVLTVTMPKAEPRESRKVKVDTES